MVIVCEVKEERREDVLRCESHTWSRLIGHGSGTHSQRDEV